MIVAFHWDMKLHQHEFTRDENKPKSHRSGRLAVLLQLMLHANQRLRCWPSIDTLCQNTGLNRPSVVEAIRWLIKHGAIVLVPYEKREGKEKLLPTRQHIYQLTGIAHLPCGTVPYLLMSNDMLAAVKEELDALEVNSSESELSDLELSESEPKGITSIKGIPEKRESLTRIPPSKRKTKKPDATPPVKKKDYENIPYGDRYAIIHAWELNTPGGVIAAYRSDENQATAADLYNAGITEQNVADFVSEQHKDPFWQGKTLKLQKVAELIPAWLESKKQTQAFQGIWSQSLHENAAPAAAIDAETRKRIVEDGRIERQRLLRENAETAS